MQTLKNLARLIVFSVSIISYILTCMYLSHHYSGDIYYGLAATFLPLIIFSVWDMSKNQVENQLHQEEQLVNELSRKHE